MTSKLNRVNKLSATARFPRTFRSSVANIDDALLDRLTATQIAAMINGPMARSQTAGNHDEAKQAMAGLLELAELLAIHCSDSREDMLRDIAKAQT